MKRLPASIAVIITAGAVLQTANAQNENDTSGEDAIVVTATRTAQTVDESLASVTVITREDIEKSKAQSVPELLRGIPGVDVTTSGGFGQLSSFFLRGTNSTQVLALVDGLKFGSVSAGQTAWEFLPVTEIERIEIVRGPRSSLYGSEAIGGVIQIFTRTGKGPPKARVELGAGTQETRTVATGISGGSDTNWYNVSASRFRTDGFDIRPDLNQPDKDGYDNNSASTRYGHRFTNGGQVELFGTRAEGTTEFDAAFGGNETDFTIQIAGAKYRQQVSSRWNASLEGGRTKDKRTTFRSDGAGSSSRFDSEIDSFSWQNDLTFDADQLVTLGADYRDEKIDSTASFLQKSRDNTGVFGQYQGHFGGHDFLFGLRNDDNEQFGNETTGNIAWGYNLGSPTRLVASFGTGFRAPTFNDLFFPDFFGSPSSNPNLEPERSKSLEFGARGKLGGTRWDVRIYRTEIDDLIVSSPPLFIPQNIQEVTIKGLEAEISAFIADWLGRLALSFVDPRNDTTGKDLPRRANETLRFDMERRYGKTNLLFTLIAQSSRFDNTANTIKVPGYGIVNIAVRHQLSKNWEIGGRINNLLDKEYQTVAGFDELERNLLFTVAFRPQIGRSGEPGG